MNRPLSIALLAALGALAAEAAEYGVHYYRLSNGMQLVVSVRPELGLAAMNLTVNVGSIDDPPGESGMAHILEHVTLSGSMRIGTLSPQTEQATLAELDQAYAAMEQEKRSAEPDMAVLVGLQQRVEQAQRSAQRACETGEILGGRLESRGAVGLNASTTADSTHFFTWIPPTDVELWISLEAERLRHPILRRFYSERNVILREVAGLTGGRPTMQELFMRELFPGAPASQSLAGAPDQISGIDRPKAFAYFHRYYQPYNIAIAIVGDVDPENVHRLCERYFADWKPDGPFEAPRSLRVAPPALAERRIKTFNSIKRPIAFLAFPQSTPTPETAARLDAILELINSEDLSPVSRALNEKGIAWSLGASANYPSQKQPPVFLVHVYGNPGVTHDRLVRETLAQLRDLSRAPDEDIQGAILGAERRLATQLDDAPTLAAVLAESQLVRGDWSLPFRRLEQLRRLEPADVRQAAVLLFAEGRP